MRFRWFLLICAIIAGFYLAADSDKQQQYKRQAYDSVQTGLSIVHRTATLLNLSREVNVKLSAESGSIYIKLDDIPPYLQQAVIATEDNRFYRHHGIDVEGILRATLVNLQEGQYLEGGSTITQQLVKNMFLSQEKTMARKAEEIALALDMEMRFSKEQILEMYLNTIYFGSGATGIGQASRIYFGKPAQQLNLAECAMLAGIPNAPSLYSPYVNMDAAKQRQQVVLNSMVRYGFISQGQAKQAFAQELSFAQ